MGRFKKWFGAMDAAEPLQEEPAVAQAGGDDSKMTAIKSAVSGFLGSMGREELEAVADYFHELADRAGGVPGTDAEPAPEAEPEEEDAPAPEAAAGKADADPDGMKKAMDACGLDADDDDQANAFAEGVKFGEKLELDPDERKKLDSEHESEGMKKAMDACGLDADNPASAHAFGEGVKFGEKKKLDEAEPAADEELDSEEASALEKALDLIPGLTPDQREKLIAALSELVKEGGDATVDDDTTAEEAQDAAIRGLRQKVRKLRGGAFDSATIKAAAKAEAFQHMRQLRDAVRTVKPLVGEVDELSFDSASDVYGYALEQGGYNPRQYPRAAWRGMVEILRSKTLGINPKALAQDARMRKLSGPFAGLSKIGIAE